MILEKKRQEPRGLDSGTWENSQGLVANAPIQVMGQWVRVGNKWFLIALLANEKKLGQGTEAE